jgi:hypothetical protein
VSDRDAARAEHYRALALEVHAMAAQMTDLEAQHMLRQIAIGYEHMASIIERRTQYPATTFVSYRPKT